MSQNVLDLDLIQAYTAAIEGEQPMVSQEIRQAKIALQAKRKSLREELSRVEQAIRALEGVINVPVPMRRKRSGGVKEAIATVLREHGGVMHADDILDAVKNRGVELSSADPKATVVTALLRMRDAGEVDALGKNQFRWMDDGLPILLPSDGEEDGDEK